MHNEVPFYNDSKNTRYIGGQMIPAGETRMINGRDVPGFIEPAEVAETDAAPDTAAMIEKILAHSIKQLAEVLPGLSLDELAAVKAAEESKELPRKGAIEAFAAERIRRAGAMVDSNAVDMDAYTALVAGMNDTDLAAQDAKGNTSLQAVIDMELQRRAVAVFKAEMSAFEVVDLQSLKSTYADQPAYLEALDQLLADKGA